jgi:branched-chain amino acid transport system substrate-binding protein
LFPVGTTDFSATIKKWKSANVEILWGNSNGPDFGVMRRQMQTMQFKPNLGYGVGIEIWGHPEMKGAKGWGDTSPRSLADRWIAATGQKFNQMVPHGYLTVQILATAIEQAGTTETKAVQAALKSLDFTSIYGRIKFDENNVTRIPIVFGQWMKDDKGDWALKIVLSKHDFLPIEADPIFPIPYD